jgi:hypothetical protein
VDIARTLLLSLDVPAAVAELYEPTRKMEYHDELFFHTQKYLLSFELNFADAVAKPERTCWTASQESRAVARSRRDTAAQAVIDDCYVHRLH